jgi:hypothetical protein
VSVDLDTAIVVAAGAAAVTPTVVASGPAVAGACGPNGSRPARSPADMSRRSGSTREAEAPP